MHFISIICWFVDDAMLFGKYKFAGDIFFLSHMPLFIPLQFSYL